MIDSFQASNRLLVDSFSGKVRSLISLSINSTILSTAILLCRNIAAIETDNIIRDEAN